MRSDEPIRNIPARPGQHGFGMLEVVISIVLLGLVGSTTFYFLHNQDSNTTLGTDLSKGMFIGKRKLDSLRIIRYGMVQAGSDTVNNRYIRRWYITTDLDTDRKQVDLLVSWPLSASHTITFNTLVSDDQYKVY